MEKINNNQENKNADQSKDDTLQKLGHAALVKKKMSLDDFKVARNNNQVERDKRYLIERKNDFSPKGFNARQFEIIATHGFVDDQWLGNVPGLTGRAAFNVSPVYAAGVNGVDYDDVVNRIDSTVCISDSDGENETFMGFDITLDDTKFREKILKTTNKDNVELPFGFSELDYAYLKDGTLLPHISNVPHYCITMNIDEETARNYKHHYDYLTRDAQGNPKEDRLEDARKYLRRFNGKARFMVISEIFEQTKLSLAMLPDLNGRDNMIIDEARTKLQYIDKKLCPALARAADQCPLEISRMGRFSKNGVLSDDDKAVVAARGKRKELQKKINDIWNSDLPHQEKVHQMAVLRMKVYKIVSDVYCRQDPKYKGLIETIKSLSQLEREGKAEQLKAISARNR